MLAIYALARRKLRMSTFRFSGHPGRHGRPHGSFWAVAAPSPAAGAATSTVSDDVNLGPAALDARLARFLRGAEQDPDPLSRARRRNSPLLTFLILHVCSLSWDDLRTLQLAPDAFFGTFPT